MKEDKTDKLCEEPPEELRDKKTGTSNFRRCGWCNYAMGTHRYGYCISGKCELLDDYNFFKRKPTALAVG